jgi:hypothetical protein
MEATMDGTEMFAVSYVKVAVNLFFGFEDFAAFRTHVLSSSGVRGAAAFLDCLIHITHIFTC